MKENQLSFELEGTILSIADTQSFASGFSKRECVLTVPEGDYPQEVKIEFLKDKADILDGFKVGQNMRASVNLRGSEFNGKHYVNLVAWRAEAIGGETTAPPSNDPGEAYKSKAAVGNDGDGTDIPF